MVRLNINIVGISDLNWTEMGEFHSDDHYIYHCGQVSLRRNGAALIVPLESPKFGTWTQPQKQQNDLSSFPGKTIQHHCRSSLHPNHWCERSWSWLLLWTPTTPRTSTREDILFFIGGWNAKVGNQDNTLNNRQVWPWSTKCSRAKEREGCQGNSLVIADTLFQQPKKYLHTWISSKAQCWNKIDYVLCISRWRSSIQSAKTRCRADCGWDHEFLIAKFRFRVKKVGKTIRPFRYDLNQIPYDYTLERINRFEGWDMIDRVPE